MNVRCDQGDGAFRSCDASEANSIVRVLEQRSQYCRGDDVINANSPEIIHVEAQDFKEVVQRLTGQEWNGTAVVICKTSSQIIHVEAHNFKEVVHRLTGREWNQYDMVEEHSAPHHVQSESNAFRTEQYAVTPGQSPISTSSHHALEEFLDRLDRENPSPQPSPNVGLFPTAGLVKGVNLELGLQWRTGPNSVCSPSPKPSESSSPQKSASSTCSHYSLEEHLDKMDTENAFPQPSSDSWESSQQLEW
ncbi:unnamed protein product [Calypogeia fissa]